MIGQQEGRTSPPAPAGTPALLTTLARWAAQLDLAQVPPRVVDLATSQVLAQLAAIRAGLAHSRAAALVNAFGTPWQADPRQSAAVLATLGCWLNLDDTAYAGHLAPSTVAVPLAYAEADGLSGAALLTSVIAANECAARITAAATLGPLRGQSALHTHLGGAVAGRLASQRAPAHEWVNALGLAFAAPPWPVMHAFLSGDAKLLHVLPSIRTAMDACDAAAAGIRGAADVLEHPRGFLERFAAVPLPETVVEGLGSRWHTETLSFKLRPGGPGIDAAVDCAVGLHHEIGDATITSVLVDASIYTIYAGRQAERYLAGPDSPISALLLSTAYPVATALLTGDLTVADFDTPAVREPARWDLATRVRLRHDPTMTRRLFASVAPFGAALQQAGERAVPWLRQVFGDTELATLASSAADSSDAHGPCPAAPGSGPDSGEFRHADKATPARVTVDLADGRTLSREQVIPLGAAGAHTRGHHRELVRAKFLAQGGRDDVADALSDLPDLPPERLARTLRLALA